MAEILLKNIWLSYPVLGNRGQSREGDGSKGRIGGLIRRSSRGYDEVLALRGVNLRCQHGDRIAVVGANGAGKTTLLKTLAGIYKPQQGRITRVGKTVAIINPAVGLEQNLSGYENIRTIGLLSGQTLREIDTHIPEIREFTELADYLDLPVSSYSAGMRTRLAFAVATTFHPDILVADENLGTGDAHFVERAKARMEDMMSRSSIIVLATHSERMIRQFCNRAILLHHGQVMEDGAVNEVLEAYKGGKHD